MESFEEFKENFKKKAQEAKKKAADDIWYAANWCRENKELTIALSTVGVVAIKGATKIATGIIRHANLRQERYNKDNYIFDRSINRWVELRRPLKESDYREILEARERGERLGDVLLRMDLVK